MFDRATRAEDTSPLAANGPTLLRLIAPDMPAAARFRSGITVLALLALFAAFAPWIAPHDLLEQDLLKTFQPPAWLEDGTRTFLFGTDSLGRDLVSRLIHGARGDHGRGGRCGARRISRRQGRRRDLAVGRDLDGVSSGAPVDRARGGAGLHTVVIAIVVIDWTRFRRVVRAEVLVQKLQDYVASAITIGLTPMRILRSDILPNVAPLFVTPQSLEMGIDIVIEAILSFVGLSVANDTATWGGMIQEGRQYVRQAWWLMALPMGCIIVSVLATNALGDGLREIADPLSRSAR